jgi:hypothetical protein
VREGRRAIAPASFGTTAALGVSINKETFPMQANTMSFEFPSIDLSDLDAVTGGATWKGWGQWAGAGAGGWPGGLAGAAGGAALGTAVAPGVGTVVGGVAGRVAGTAGGGYVGSRIGGWIGSKFD